MSRESFVYDRYQGKVVRKEDYQPPERTDHLDASHLLVNPVQRGHWIWDRAKGDLVPADEFHHRRAVRAGANIIRDIEPYQAVASDLASGDNPVIGGRRQHREFLSRNGYVELGNDVPRNRRQEMPSLIPDIKRAMGE